MNLDTIKEKIASDSVKVVSFDIFDTLLCRPCLFPYNLFRVIGNRCGFDGDFETLRREAEHRARKNRPKGDDDITFDDIYRELALVIGDEKASKLKETEIMVEAEALYPRKPIEELFHYALSLKKRVIIVSDMYLPTEVLESILRKNRYDGFEKLYVSNAYMMSKDTKRLLYKVIDDLAADGVSAGEILHIGDNPIADVKHTQECGMQAIHVESGISAMKKSDFFNNLTSEYIEANLLTLGDVANHSFDPFMKD